MNARSQQQRSPDAGKVDPRIHKAEVRPNERQGAKGVAAVKDYEWLRELGALVCAAGDRDLSRRDQEAQVKKAHTDLFNVLDGMEKRLAWMRGYEKSLNRRAEVEEELLQCARGKRPMPDAEQLRKWAIRLGVPEEWRQQ